MSKILTLVDDQGGTCFKSTKTRPNLSSISGVPPLFTAAFIDGKETTLTKKAKLLRLTINSFPTWNDHTKEPLRKTSRKLYFLVQLKCPHVPSIPEIL